MRTRKVWTLTTATVALLLGFVLAQPTISVDPIGHWHVFDGKTLTIQVNDEAGLGMAGLDLVVHIARAGSERVTERSVADAEVVDLGGGSYSVDHTVTNLGAHALLVRFALDGQVIASAPLAFEVSKAGEEGIMVTVDGTAYVYQIRNVWQPGHIHAHESELATLSFEVMRGIPEGDDIDWQRPWSNPFDHVTDAREPIVLIESADGGVSEQLTPTYLGRGIYEVERVFPLDEVHVTGGEYTARLSFTDPYHGGDVTHAEPYSMHVSAPH